MGRTPWVERVGRLGDGFDVVVGGAGTLRVSAAELARPGVAPGAHLRVVSEPGPAARAGVSAGDLPEAPWPAGRQDPRRGHSRHVPSGRIELTQPPRCLPQRPDQRRRSVAYRSMVQARTAAVPTT